MFNELNYKTETWENLDIHQFDDKIKKLKIEMESENYGCLLFFLMCHGNKDEIVLEKCKKKNCFECKGRSMKREDFESYFDKPFTKHNIAIVLFMNNCRSLQSDSSKILH